MAKRLATPRIPARRAPAAPAVCAIVLALAGVARAQSPIDANSLGAAIAIPYLTSTGEGLGDRITVATVTNGLKDVAAGIHLVWLSGDPGDGWSALDTDCALTPLETTWFVFEREETTALVTFECSRRGQMSPDPSETNEIVRRSVPGMDGIMFVALECQRGVGGCPFHPLGLRTLPFNALLGSSTVIDFGQGYAVAVDAVHIQGLSNDGDRLYRFDGIEYAAFPSVLTTQYIAPDDDITLELMLFTLDGRNVGGAPSARLLGYMFDDDENRTSAAIAFACFVVQDLTEPPNRGFGLNITRPFGGHLVGHLQLFPTPTSARDAHEFEPRTGDGNGVRRRPVHGWILQTIAAGGDFVDGAFPIGGATMPGPASWARRLVQGTRPIVPVGGDVPALNTGP